MEMVSRIRKANNDDESSSFQDENSGGDYLIHDDSDKNDKLKNNNGSSLTQEQCRKLFWLNVAAFIVQSISASQILLLVDNERTYPFYTNYPLAAVDNDENDNGNGDNGGRPDLGPNAQVAFRINVGYLSAAFLALSATDHFLVCTCLKGVYERGLSNNYNIFRWIEYSLSASIMRILVGVLSGVSDLHMQFLQFGLTATTMLFGLVFELENQKNRLSNDKNNRPVKWYLYWLGFLPHFFSWTVIVGYFFYAVSSGESPPDFVYAIIFIIFFLDLTFAVVLGLQWSGKCGFQEYVNGEIAFIVLSFTSKNALAWINFFGGNR